MQEFAEKTGKAGMEVTTQFCTFWLSGRHFGVNILDVKEIHPDVAFTPIYHAAQQVRGYVNIRGQIHLILDLRLVMGFGKKEVDDDSCLVIFKTSVAEPFGVLVDKIGDVVEVTNSQIEDRQELDDALPLAGNINITGGVCRLEKSLLVVLNARGILSSIANIKAGE